MSSTKKVLKTVYLPGVFDLFHIGHLNAITQAKAFGNYLIVGVQADKSVFKQKKKYPVLNQKQRIRIMQSIKGVDRVILYRNTDQSAVLKSLRPRIIAVNHDYGTQDTQQKKTLGFAAKYNIQVKRIHYTQAISTTKLRKKI